jgi:CRP/FNR family cyclic AMP-dependent transcriptional regulator
MGAVMTGGFGVAIGGAPAPEPASGHELCLPLREDVELAEAVPASCRERAAASCRATLMGFPPGRWVGSHVLDSCSGIGLLVLRGMLVRRVVVSGRGGAELLGGGDVLGRCDISSELSMLQPDADDLIIEPLRLAHLDEDFCRRELACYHDLAAALLARVVRRSRNLSVNLAIVQQPRVDVRLYLLFWHLAERWGRMRSDGVLLRLRLTHVLLADLVAARRPSVTLALSRLASAGLVWPAGGGWLLRGGPPGSAASAAAVLDTGDARCRAYSGADR